MYLKDERGYSLIEVIIVIVIIGIGVSMISYGFSLINRSNLKKYVNEYHSDVRYAKNQSMTFENTTFYIQWDYDSVNDEYYYELYKSEPTVTPDTLVKRVDIHSTVDVNLDNESGGMQPLETYTSDQVKLTYEAGSGDLVNGDGFGKYEFYKSDDTKKIVEIIESTGRVFIDE